MSAPKRTNFPRANENRTAWLSAFRKRISDDPTARRAWEMLARAGLETTASRLLWTYAHPPTEQVKKAHRNIEHTNRRIKALIRAGKVERDRHKAGDRRASRFFDRYWQKHLDVVRSPMPFADDGVTVKDWVLSRTAAGKEMPGLAETKRAFVSLGPRSPISDRKFWLVVLACCAANVGIRLGAERLTALGLCADPDSALDPRTLARFLASIPASFKAKCLRDFLNLPALPLLPPQN